MAEPADRTSADTAGQLRSASPIRASDADRQSTVLVLQDAMTRGLLTPDEASDRIAVAFAAVFLRDLEPLTTDLPQLPIRQSGPPGWRVLWFMAVEQFRWLLRDNRNSKYSRRRIAVALLLACFAVLVFGFLAAGFLSFDSFDGGRPDGPAGFVRH